MAITQLILIVSHCLAALFHFSLDLSMVCTVCSSAPSMADASDKRDRHTEARMIIVVAVAAAATNLREDVTG